MNKSCKQCGKQFIVTDEDLEFLKKISPTFAGKTFEIPAPTLCPDCRKQRRLTFRNERSLYKRICPLCQKSIVSMFSPDKNLKVYCQECWWSDRWDPLDYGQEFDFSRPFFEQFNKLAKLVPYNALANSQSQNSDYCNYAVENKNCYLCYSVGLSEDCMYGRSILECKDCVDCSFVEKCQLCHNCINCRECYDSTDLVDCNNCTDSHYLYDCQGCDNCFMSWNLRHKKFYVLNKKYSENEYREEIKKYKNVGLFKKNVATQAIHRYSHNTNTDNSIGEYLISCKNCSDCFYALEALDCKHLFDAVTNISNCYDGSYLYLNTSFCYEVCSSSENNMTCFSVASWSSANIYYCQYCNGCQDCFGCVGLRNKQYCILNKQYSKEEYEEKVAKIIEHMQKTNEWGDFFPIGISQFGYNETAANDYFPLSKDQAAGIGATWQDNDYSLKSDGPFYNPEADIIIYKKSEKARKELLDGVLKCEVSGKAFKILPKELLFYIKNNVSIPRKHYDVRYKELFEMRNPHEFFHRQCMCEELDHDHEGRCKNEFETTYAPDRLEKVYCENCYQKSVI